ncbi:hypothetical protein FDG2_1925 [Candidatus Protofrankia californiensis]|uniref:Uncharacterized protein n=1 Tax=Candidatus Protofrankia californiensis TaxID=1839754 RepID=A0A1C3NWM4_9ACTN|nr:hypothetical protein FDG2_1925 [Candidatus Protofrankia californiensis]
MAPRSDAGTGPAGPAGSASGPPDAKRSMIELLSAFLGGQVDLSGLTDKPGCSVPHPVASGVPGRVPGSACRCSLRDGTNERDEMGERNIPVVTASGPDAVDSSPDQGRHEVRPGLVAISGGAGRQPGAGELYRSPAVSPRTCAVLLALLSPDLGVDVMTRGSWLSCGVIQIISGCIPVDVLICLDGGPGMRRRFRQRCSVRIDHSAIDHSAIDHSAIDHSAIDHSAIDHSAALPTTALPVRRSRRGTFRRCR